MELLSSPVLGRSLGKGGSPVFWVQFQEKDPVSFQFLLWRFETVLLLPWFLEKWF